MTPIRVRVLLVEDEETDYVLTRRFFSEFKSGRFDLDWVATYNAALQAMECNQHDVYLLDYRLGEDDGLELLREAIAKGCNAPVILLTAHDRYEIDVRAMELGAADFLVKGEINASVLERAIRYAMERKRAAEALRASEEQYRILFESNPHPMWVFDLETFAFLVVNNAAVRHYGYSREEFLLMTMKEISAAEELAALHGVRSTCGSGLEPLRVSRHRRKDGTIIDVEITSHPLFFQGKQAMLLQAYDITERKRAEEALWKAEKKYHSIFENAIEGIFQATAAGQFITANPALARMLGYESPDELISKITDIQQHLYVDPEAFSAMKHLLEADGAVTDFKAAIHSKDGSLIWVSLNARAEKDENGALSYYEGTLEDITERLYSEEQMKNSREQLRALSARLESAREQERTYIAREIHDALGQSLTELKLDLAWFAKRLTGPGHVPRPSVRNKLKSMSKSIDGTMQSVRRISSKLRPVVLDTFGLKAAIEWQTKEFQARTGIRCSLALPAETISVEPELSTTVFRIFQEILTNVARHAYATRVNIGMKADGHALLLEIQDNGKGITERQISAAHSLGILGMRERALALQGELRISGSHENGTTVLLKVPYVTPSQNLNALQQKADDPPLYF